MSEKKWTPLHHAVWRVLQKNLNESLKKSPFLVCVSGGADSVALFYVLKDLPIDIQVFHAHHGLGDNLPHRDEALAYVQKICEKEKIPLLVYRAQKILKSENDFRNFRLEFLKKWSQENPHGIIVTAHHEQDLLETRMMRLIRGTGPQGLSSMKIWKAPTLKPFLEMSPLVFKKFLLEQKIQWIDDPTNQSPRYFRNWIRHRWLPYLEKARPGSRKRLASSLETLSHLGESSLKRKLLKRAEYSLMSPYEQLQTLALLLKSQGLSQFTSGQLKEVQKRLDNPQARLTFKAAGAIWTVNAQRILLKPQ